MFQGSTYAKRANFGHKDQQKQQPKNSQKTPSSPEKQPNVQKNPTPPAGTSSPKRTPPQPTKVIIPTSNYYEILNLDMEEEETPNEDPAPTTKERSQESISSSPKKKNNPKPSRSDPSGAIAKETPKEQRPVIPERKRKLPSSNAELDRFARKKRKAK